MDDRVLRPDRAGPDPVTEQADPATFQIRSNFGGAEVEIKGSEVRLSRRGLQACVSVYELEKNETIRGLGRLFESLARDWRGWEGERIWSSLEGEFQVAALHDGLGTIELVVRLGHLDPTTDGLWQATASLFVDAGGLDTLARTAVSALGD
jgi:hypothetical protein